MVVSLTVALLVFRAADSVFGAVVVLAIAGMLPWHALLDGPFVFQAFVGATPLALIDVIARRAALIRPAATAVQHVRSKER